MSSSGWKNYNISVWAELSVLKLGSLIFPGDTFCSFKKKVSYDQPIIFSIDVLCILVYTNFVAVKLPNYLDKHSDINISLL